MANDIANKMQMPAPDSIERFFELSRDMLAIASAHTGHWLRVNPAMTETLGWSEAELLSMPFMDIVHPDDRPRSTDATSSLAAGQSLAHFEHRVLCKSGAYKWVEWQTGAYPAEGLMYCFGRDMTERREQEEWIAFLLRLSDVLRSLSAPEDIHAAVTHVTKDYFKADRCYYAEVLDGHYVIRRDASSEGLPSIIGKYPIDSFPLFKTIVEAGAPFIVADAYTTDVLDENLRQQCIGLQVISFLAVPVIKELVPAGILFVAQCKPREWSKLEIRLAVETAERTWQSVEKASAEHALRESEQQLRILLKQKDEFIDIASHELKTPITSIKAYAEIVTEQLEVMGDHENASLLNRLNVQIDKLNNLISHLLDTTKISEGQLKLNPETVDINLLVDEKIEELTHASNHRLLSDMEQLKPVWADRERIEQVVTNLLSNAIKYSKAGTTITVTGQNTIDGILISIRDEGYGISEEDQQRIFERFFRVTQNNMATFPGIGLGLYITAQIIRRHEGTIKVESKLREGSVFSFTLPYKNAAI